MLFVIAINKFSIIKLITISNKENIEKKMLLQMKRLVCATVEPVCVSSF